MWLQHQVTVIRSAGHADTIVAIPEFWACRIIIRCAIHITWPKYFVQLFVDITLPLDIANLLEVFLVFSRVYGW